MSGVVPGFPPVPLSEATPNSLNRAASFIWVRRIATVVNTLLQGKLNVVLPVTLTPSAATTTIIDARIDAYSALLFSPLTAHAAAEVPTLYVTNQISGQATLNHSNNAETDRSFNMAIIG